MCRDVCDHRLDFSRREAKIHRRSNEGADLAGAIDFKVFGTILRKHADPILALDAATAQCIAKPVNTLGMFCEGDAAFTKNDRRALARKARIARDNVGN